MFMLSSYDYLGLVGHPYIEAATINAIKNFGTGTGGARMLAGTNQLHRQLEKKIALFKGKPAALSLFIRLYGKPCRDFLYCSKERPGHYR